MVVTRWVAVLGATAGVLLSTAGAATAANGKTEMGPEHANSICSFSGLNDDPDEAFPFDGRVQSYGQLVKRGQKDVFPSPGEVCNAHNLPWQDVTGSH